MQSYVTHTGILLLAAPLLAALVCFGLSVSLFKAKATPGWRSVRPGIGYWIGFTLSLGLAALIGWVWLYVGSVRADGLFQMNIAWWLAFLFGCGSAFAGFRIVSLHRLDLRWRGETLRWSGSADVAMRDLQSLTTNAFGFAIAVFKGGLRLAIDFSAFNGSQLVERLADVNGLATDEEAPEH